MREEPDGRVILEPEFDASRTGRSLRHERDKCSPPANVVASSSSALSAILTLDSHAAFVHKRQSGINTADLEKLPKVLERTLR